VNRNYNTDNDLLEEEQSDREISLGTTTILGLFFLLALICAICFGFGYSLRGRIAQPSASAAQTVSQPDDQEDAPAGTSTAKPSPSSLEVAPVAGTTSAATGDAATSVPLNTAPAPQAESAKPAIRTVALTHPSVSAPAASAAANGAVVQIAAVSHKEDAQILEAALKKRGYTVAIRQEPQDSLLHVQLGPFPSRKDADVMRQRLLADGYNAIVK
jgi:cell division septation protein DedD